MHIQQYITHRISECEIEFFSEGSAGSFPMRIRFTFIDPARELYNLGFGLWSPSANMKTTLSHLPEDKQEELKHSPEIIVEKVARRNGHPFWQSRAWRLGEEMRIFRKTTEYVSDYDILVITKDRKSAKDDEKWWDLKKMVNSNDEQTSVSPSFIMALGL
jgi:hypothetical protein